MAPVPQAPAPAAPPPETAATQCREPAQRSRPAGRGLLLAALLGAAYGLLFLSWGFVTASVNDGRVRFEADRVNAVVGLNYFVQDAWQFPLLDVARLNEDGGANIVFTDSIPLLALPLKAVYPLHRRLVDPYGPYLVLCFALQGAAFSWLLLQTGERRWPVHACAVLLACSTPALLNRWGHVALCSHYLLGGAIALYLRSRREGLLRSSAAAMAVLVALSLLVHAYLAAMVIGMFVVLLLQARADGRQGFAPTFAWLAGGAAGVYAILFCTGYVRPGGASIRGGGYGKYAMNLLAPFWPEGSLLTGMDAVGRWGFEGVLFLGLGTLGLFGVALVATPRALLAMVARHWLLAALALGFTLVATSNVLMLGSRELVAVPLGGTPEALLATFRASARFFWPVTYLLLAATICAVTRRFRPGVAALLLTFAAVAQVVDTVPFRRPLAAALMKGKPVRTTSLRSLTDVAAAHSKVCFYPLHWQLETHEHRVATMRLLLAASIANVPTNNAYLARPLRRPASPRSLEEVVRSCPADALLVFTPWRAHFHFARGTLGRRVLRAGALLLAPRPGLPPTALEGLERVRRANALEVAPGIRVERGSRGGAAAERPGHPRRRGVSRRPRRRPERQPRRPRASPPPRNG